MAVTIKTGAMKYKNGGGEYVSFNAVASETEATQIANINSAGAAQINAIETKGAQTIDTIPDDYTSLQNEVDDLKSAFDNYTGRFALTWEQGSITSSGESGSNNLIRSSVYSVHAGDLIRYIVPTGCSVRFFQKNSDTSYTNLGDYSGSGTYVVTADMNIRFRMNYSPTASAISPTVGDSFVAYYVDDNPVTPQMFGAVGDGVTDDTSAFQAAIMSGKCVYVPTSNNEKYLITNSLDIVNSCKRIYGDVVHNGTATNGAIIFDLTNYSGSPENVPLFKFTYATQAISIGGLIIKSVEVNSANVGICVDATKFVSGTTVMPDKDITLKNVAIAGFNKAIAMTGRGCNATNCTFSQCVNVGVYNWIGDYTDSNTAHPKEYNQRGISFKSCRFHSIRGTSIVVESGHAYGLMVSGCVMDVGRGSLVEAEEEAWNWNITNNIIQGQTETAFVFNNGIRNSIISNNVVSRDSDFWVSASYTMPENHMIAYGATGCVISGNVINGSTSDAIIINGYKATLTWEQGNLTASGESASNNLIRTTNYIEVADGESVNVEYDDSAYGVRAVVFDSASMSATKQNYIFSSSTKTYTNSTGETRYLRFRLERVPTAAILPEVGNQALFVINTECNGVALVGNVFNNVTGTPVSTPYSGDNIIKTGNADTQGRTV